MSYFLFQNLKRFLENSKFIKFLQRSVEQFQTFLSALFKFIIKNWYVFKMIKLLCIFSSLHTNSLNYFLMLLRISYFLFQGDLQHKLFESISKLFDSHSSLHTFLCRLYACKYVLIAFFCFMLLIVLILTFHYFHFYFWHISLLMSSHLYLCISHIHTHHYCHYH